ncbi:SCO5918 family protein [Streptomyces sp. NPDC006332]|uniref:SCO5918 family protein n=1 Tax=Streptomyces sp. NPDC006332 TaxID=3155456 RepID=UPI0033B65FA2
MRCVIARYPFDLTKDGVLESMKGVDPETVVGESVTIGRRRYPVKQVGQIITRQDRRDFTSGEVVRAMTKLGFTCHQEPAATPAPAPALSPVQAASAMLGGTSADETGGQAG